LRVDGRQRDERRTSRLLFARELMSGTVDEASLRVPAVARAVRSAPTPGAGGRAVDRVRLRTGRTSHLTAVAALAQARREVLGEAAGRVPRLLVRVDEFPYAGSFTEHGRLCAAFAQFEQLMAAAGVPYLLAVTPRVAREVLNPDVDEDRAMVDAELEILRSLPRDRVTFALHGLDHRTRLADPRRRSEVAGLDPAQVGVRLDRAQEILTPLGIEPRVYVPPFNHFEARHYGTLAERFEVICAGPETVRVLGLRPGPVWWQDAVLLPSYPPVYGNAAALRVGVDALLEAPLDLWVPLVVHWEWEAANGWVDLERLLQDIAPYAVPWETFLDEVRWSRDDRG
jgi:hypothetical protein